MGWPFFVSDALTTLWYTRSSYAEPGHCAYTGRRVLSSIDALVQELLDSAPYGGGPVASTIAQAEREEAVARHELVAAEREAQAEAFRALSSGSGTSELRARAEQVGAALGARTAQVLERLTAER